MSSGITILCGYCRRPIIGLAVHVNGMPYHHECTRGPSGGHYYTPPAISEDKIRQIVREELAKELAKRSGAYK